MLFTVRVFRYFEDMFRTHKNNARRELYFIRHFFLQFNVEFLPVLLENPRGAPANQANLRSWNNRKEIRSGYET